MITSLLGFFFFLFSKLRINLSRDRLTSYLCGFKFIQKNWTFSGSDILIRISLFPNILRQRESQIAKIFNFIIFYDTMSLMNSKTGNSNYSKTVFLKRFIEKGGFPQLMKSYWLYRHACNILYSVAEKHKAIVIFIKIKSCNYYP